MYRVILRAASWAFLSVLLASPSWVQAQALEEIVVTAQRRVQSLQDVPISIYAMSGEELQRQGFKDLRGMSDFSPTVQFDDTSIIGPTISIRGFGTTGNAVTLESAVPIFVDNLHYSRQSMIKTAFLDVEAVEILKGPQPVYFGQNATAGAFNIRSKRPTPEWDGDILFEYGDRKNQSVQAAIGGPVTDTVGIRAAITYDQEGGFLKHIVTGEGVGKTENLGGRFTLQWQPSDRLTLLGKVDAANLDRDAEAHTICWEGGSTYEDNDPTGEPISATGIFVDPPHGIGWNTPLVTKLQPTEDCYDTKYGITAGGPFYAPPVNSRARDARRGHPDVRLAAAGFMNNSSVPGWFDKETTNEGIEPYEDLRTRTALLVGEYEFVNGMTAEWNAGYVRYLRDYSRDNQNSPFFDNFQGREEDYHQWSTELRVNSPLGGMFEWVVGAFYQIGDLDVYSSSLGAHVRRAQRFNRVWEDQEWKSLFGVLTFNFLDNRASIDLGARYSDLYKETFGEGYGAQWVFDVRPCRASADDFMLGPAGAAADVATCPTHPSAVQITMADNPRIYDAQADLGNLWTILYDQPNSRQGRDTPPNWRGDRAHAVGLTAPDFTVRPDGGPWLGNFSSDRIDPQIVLRYRPSGDMSFYARWAKAYKAGGFDTGQTSLPTDIRGYVFGPEYAETFEGGVKGSFLDGRGRYDANLFNIEFTDLQLSVSTPNPDDPFANINAGAQRVRGLEVGAAYAFSDRLLASLNAAFLDGEMSVFPNAPCTETELENAPASGCDPLTELIDRSGQSAPNTPDWKFVTDVEYWMPVPRFDQHKLTFNTRFYLSDGYCDTIGDCGITRWDTHGDANFSLSLGDLAGSWELTGYVKNLFHPTPIRNFDGIINPDRGVQTPSIAPSRSMSYGVRLNYNFF